MTDREDKIRQRAYSLWEEEGHPQGRAEHHWQRAAREVETLAEAVAPARPAGGSPALAEPELAPKTKGRARAATTQKRAPGKR